MKKGCALCGSMDLSDIPGEEHLCVPCSAWQFHLELEKQIENDLDKYEKRTGVKYTFEEFYYDCYEGNIDKKNLKGLKELTKCFEDAEINRKEWEWNGQFELNFNNNLPF